MAWRAWLWLTWISVGSFPRLSLHVSQKELAVHSPGFDGSELLQCFNVLLFMFCMQYCCNNSCLAWFIPSLSFLFLVLFMGLNTGFFTGLKDALCALLFPPIIVFSVKRQLLLLANNVCSCSLLFLGSHLHALFSISLEKQYSNT